MEIPGNLKLDFIVRPNDPKFIREMVKESSVFNSSEVEIAGELAEAVLSGSDTSYHFVFLRDKEDRPWAYACYGEIPMTDKRYDLYWIVVSPKYQKSGLASIVLENTLKDVSKRNGVIIYAETSGTTAYAPARAFYLKKGFQQVACYPHFYREGDDKIVFSKHL